MAHLRTVPLALSESIYKPGVRPRFATFPVSGVVSVVSFMENGAGVEVGLVGREGLVEAMHLLGEAEAPNTAFVQVEGTALRMSFTELQRRFASDPALVSVILSYVQTVTYSSTQLTACNRLHEVEARMARWLLMVQDRMESNVFSLTQEFLGEMLGARRSTITVVAARLQQLGLLRYSRGRIEVLDRAGLVAAACECYGVVRSLTPELWTPVAPGAAA
jgi:CRP-like cAMP-binding protein